MIDRPLSPHLSVYKPQITSTLSIIHRGTGVFLSMGSVLLAVVLVSLALGPAAFDYVSRHLNAIYGQIAMGIWTWTFYYHLCNGIRHLVWDSGSGFELPTVRRSGIAVLIISAALTALTIVAAFGGGS